MRIFGVIFILVALIASGLIGFYLSGSFDSARPGDAVQVQIGQIAPDFELSDKSGRRFNLSSLRGKVVLVNFWATWCPPCRAEIPSMEQMYKNYSQDGGLELLAINVEPEGPGIIDEFSRNYPHSFPVVFDLDAEVQNKYGVFKYPETFIVNKKGIIVERVIGGIDWAAPDVLSYLNKLMQE